MVAPPRVLCYSPYNRWALHGRWEMTILQALKLRGAEVEYVLCDGLFTDCDQFWAAASPRPADACAQCQASVTRLVADMGMDYRWLGRHLTTVEGREARRWAASLPTADLLSATYEAWPVADWVRLSIQSHFRSNHLDVADPAVERAVRSYLFSGLVACFALNRLIEESAPDVLLLFNGRQSSTRVALELARARGIRVVVHERGALHEQLTLAENVGSISLEPIRRYWDQWRDVPLTEDEAETAARIMDDRGQGRGLSWKPFSSAPQPSEDVRARLGLRADRPVWVLFTSSDDEVSGDPDWRGAFPAQREWIARTIEHARANPQLDLVIRAHPNTGSKRSTGANRNQLDDLRALGEHLPPNVRMIEPGDDVSSYSLMDLCAVGLVWVSTVALELACKGKQVVVCAGNPVRGTSFVHTVGDPEGYEGVLASLLDVAPAAVSAAVRRDALRFAYTYFSRMRIAFPLVRMPNPHEGVLAYSRLEELAPGRDAGLDRCARIVLDGEPVCLPPTAEQRGRTTDAEDALLAGFGRRRLTALAFAEELIADTTLLEAWARAFDGRDDVTLVIDTPVAQTERLVAAVTRLGLDREDGPDLVALEAGADVLASVDAVFSRGGPPPALAGAPCYDDASLGRLVAV
ncbi:MAG: hypothetical protein QOF86_4444 [Baekduia sp.]|nr:hypothetical protein [Baekduia sp.]